MDLPILSSINGEKPQIHDTAFVAPGSVVIGQVEMAARSSIWYGYVVRADSERIILREDANVQDGCILHADPGEPTVLGDRVSLGHGAIVHSATVEADSLVGIRATILNGAYVGSGSVVAAGAVVRPGIEIPPGSLVAGVPAQVRRDTDESDRAMIQEAMQTYRRLSTQHRELWIEGPN